MTLTTQPSGAAAGPGPAQSAPGASRRTQAERRERARRAILKAGLQLVAEKGVDELTLAAAGEAAGYSRALPAHYFGSKDELIAAIGDFVVSDYARRLRSGGERRDGLQGLLNRFAFYFNDARRHRAGFKAFHMVIAAAHNTPALRPACARLNAESVANIARNLREGQAAGDVRADLDPDMTGTLFLAALRGVMTQWMVDPDRVNLVAARDAFIDNVKRTVAP